MHFEAPEGKAPPQQQTEHENPLQAAKEWAEQLQNLRDSGLGKAIERVDRTRGTTFNVSQEGQGNQMTITQQPDKPMREYLGQILPIGEDNRHLVLLVNGKGIIVQPQEAHGEFFLASFSPNETSLLTNLDSDELYSELKHGLNAYGSTKVVDSETPGKEEEYQRNAQKAIEHAREEMIKRMKTREENLRSVTNSLKDLFNPPQPPQGSNI